MPEGIRISTRNSLIILSLFTLGVQSSVLHPRASTTVLPITKGHLYDKSFLPAQIGGIVGAYALSLVLVAITLLAVSKRRRDHLANGIEEVEFNGKRDFGPGFVQPQPPPNHIALNTSTTNPENYIGAKEPSPWISPSPVSSVGAPGVNRFVDQGRVLEDRVMAQSQLEEMYRHVLEHEDAKKRGIVYEVPAQHDAAHQGMRSPSSVSSFRSKKSKPAGLNLQEEKSHSRTSSLLSALRSPGRKKAMKGVSISSPIMTPQSGTFPRQESQEMSTIPPRHYAPAPPPPCPPNEGNFGVVMTPKSIPEQGEISPESTVSIDERIGSQLPGHSRSASHANGEHEPVSATSEHSQSALVGLPSSPKPGSKFPSNASLPSLPSSPKPGQSFNRSTPPVVRAGGNLPLRAYEPSANTYATTQTTKQTVFERRGPLSPGGGMTPYTATAVPYSPYQPFTPCVPMTPSLVTKEDRKRMKRMVPKTPTMTLVKSDDEVW